MTTEEKLKQRTERNAAICAYYVAGHTGKECASHFRLNRQLILQVLKAENVWQPYVKGNRTKFLGVNISEQTHDALKEKAESQGVSVSRLVSDAVDEMVKVTRNDAWILTYTGRQFWPLAPRLEDVCIEDIAHALSNICRFNGHTRHFYSVAQHCVLASNLVHRRYAREALLHDAAEAYLCDLPRPLKYHIDMLYYVDAEQTLMDVISHVFNLQTEELGSVIVVDNRLLLTERRDLMPAGHWIIDETQCLDETIIPWSAREAERSFLARFAELA